MVSEAKERHDGLRLGVGVVYILFMGKGVLLVFSPVEFAQRPFIKFSPGLFTPVSLQEKKRLIMVLLCMNIIKAWSDGG